MPDAIYDPKGNGKDKSVDTVTFVEAEPPEALRGIVHRYLWLKTDAPLAQDYRFHALPDACTYVVFDQRVRTVAGVTKLRAQSEEFNLGRVFHFVNIRFLPGVWQEARHPAVHGLVETPYAGLLPLQEVNAQLDQPGLDACVPVLSDFVTGLVRDGIVARNPITEAIFAHLDDVKSVADMARATGLSARQLQRRLKQSTGFSPHDFLKVLRLQQSLNGEDTWSYADQSHFIHSFRNATGYTPGRYAKKFDV
ncbi:helix-turn-helix domain-containing protein [Thalassococcus lentus]|uniref:AraC family transcriptional regulator n=1 Tax=Thalassococcus lentus TaxID=1210524 RepID=A0ABT4XVQ2_9RHOB|nr:AraC family transcriptional regulator [Thalassococcus lentus]MDA7426003.1 AraC family transcriptional regulator [Thalassococcus lentus]